MMNSLDIHTNHRFFSFLSFSFCAVDNITRPGHAAETVRNQPINRELKSDQYCHAFVR